MPSTDSVFAHAHRNIDAGFIENLILGGEWRGHDDYYCLSPIRGDKTLGSFHIFHSGDIWVFKDFATGDHGDMIELCSQIWSCSALDAAKKIAGDSSTWQAIPERKAQKKKESPKAVPVPLKFEYARTQIFKKSRILEISRMMKINPGENIVGVWWYKNEAGMVDGLDVRFEKEIEHGEQHEGSGQTLENAKIQKFVITFWWDGTTVRTSPAPVLVYGRDALAGSPGKTVVIHEGAKCAAIAQEALPEFVHIAWSGGSQKAGKADWSVLSGRDVVIYPDADESGFGAGIITHNRASSFAARCTIRYPYQQAVEKYGLGADIVEALKVATPEELTEYLKNGPELEVEDGNPEQAQTPGPDRGSKRNGERSRKTSEETIQNDGTDGGDFSSAISPETNNDPFRILGVADDGLAYFLDQWGRLQRIRLEALNQNFLRILADFGYWFLRYNKEMKMGKPQWAQAIEDLTQLTGKKDFDIEQTRGRGAWREPDGRICFHDGEMTIGKPDPCRLYIRKTRKDIGISEQPSNAAIRKEMLMAAADLSFSERADAVRCLAWSVLAPFCGALPWRPTGLLTGGSGTGKTVILDYILRPLSQAETCSGTDSSAAGLRQHNRTDAIGIIVEEAEADTDKKKINREEQFAWARQCTSDNSPQAWKGTQDGQGVSYGSKKMFMFLAIHPEVESEADQKRIFYVNLKELRDPWEVWTKKERRLREAFSDEKCRAVRAFVWQNLQKILDYAQDLAPLVQKRAGHSSRYAYLEAILFSAYWIVFRDKIPTEAEALEDLGRRYQEAPPEEIVPEEIRMMETLFTSSAKVIGDTKDEAQIGQMLYVVANERTAPTPMDAARAALVDRYKKTLMLHGFLILPSTGELAIQIHLKATSFKLGVSGREYHKMLRRHPLFVIQKPVKPTGGTTVTALLFKPEIIETEPPF